MAAGGRRATSYAVARMAGVSQSAVSRAFSQGASISPPMRARILKAAAELGYRPNAIARSLISGRTRLIGILITDYVNQNYPQLLHVMTETLQAGGDHLLLHMVEHDAIADGALPPLLAYRVDGVVCSARLTARGAAHCAAADTPLVMLNRALDHPLVDRVASDHEGTARLVTATLLASGHRRVAFVAGPKDSHVGNLRRRGYAAAVRAAGRRATVEAGDFTYAGGYAAGLRLLSVTPRPDAVFAANDPSALGVIDALRFEGKLDVPGDVSVVGFDDVPGGARRGYDLTTVRQPLRSMVEQTVACVASRLETPERPPEHHVLPCEIVVRGSARWVGG